MSEAVGIVTGSGDKLRNVAMSHVDPLRGEIDVLGVSVSLISISSSLLRNGFYLSKGDKFCFLKNGGRQEVRWSLRCWRIGRKKKKQRRGEACQSWQGMESLFSFLSNLSFSFYTLFLNILFSLYPLFYLLPVFFFFIKFSLQLKSLLTL